MTPGISPTSAPYGHSDRRTAGRGRYPQRVLSPEEVARLLDAAPGPKSPRSPTDLMVNYRTKSDALTAKFFNGISNLCASV